MNMCVEVVNCDWMLKVVLILTVDLSVLTSREIIEIRPGNANISESSTSATISTSENKDETIPYQIKYNKKICAFMNVSDHASYSLFDREDHSEGLSKIHNTSDIFEKFYSVEIVESCEITICELQLLNAKGRVRKCFTSGTAQFDELQLQNKTETTIKPKTKAPDPITSQYFVSTGCSCKEPTVNCSDTTCSDVILEDHECGRMYKESNCTQCRYDAKLLNESTSFTPSNTYWCQSYVIRNGCRLSISSYNPDISNVRYYSGRMEYVEMDYVRYPYPSKLECICDVDENAIEPNERNITYATINWVLPIAVFVVLSFLGIVILLGLYKCGVPLQIGKWKSQPNIEDVINKFQNGFTNAEVQTFEEDGGNKYVSVGFLAAVQQPYQNKWEIPRESIKIDKGQKLGGGQFGVVYLGTLDSKQNAGIKVAVKTAKVSSNMTYFASILDEIKMLAFIGNHPNICSLIGACTQNIQQREALIILELCKPDNLKRYIMKNKSSFLESRTCESKNIILTNANYAPLSSLSTNAKESETTIKPENLKLLNKFCMQIANGMEFLGEKQVIHIDLAARNILLTDNLDCKISDFGFSQKIHEVVNYVRIGNEYPLPFRSMALESLKDLKFTIESDCWSYAVTVYEIFSLGLDPFPEISSVGALIKNLSDGIRLQKPFHCSDLIYQKMLQCWHTDPCMRPSFTDLKIFFESLDS